MEIPAIEVDDLSKRYRIGGQREQYLSLREELVKKLSPKVRRAERAKTEFWALRHVDFSVAEGEVLGIIGRNGAGKSTLLKLLSRITPPTEGSITMRGRVASLLEVGTGFHPELSGRENIYLNGAVLGMTRREISTKFDDIVAFAEIDRFLDTPVKRYSSGMYVRLAFAVAAHLEPEILVIDEVLAVGDMEFQRKCLGKMSDVASSGRTVLFVSHNMAAIGAICRSCLVLDQGRATRYDSATDAVREYLRSGSSDCGLRRWLEDVPGDANARLLEIRCSTAEGVTGTQFSSAEPICVEMTVAVDQPAEGLTVGFDLTTQDGLVLWRTYHNDAQGRDAWLAREGVHVMRCLLPSGVFNGGSFYVSPRISIHAQRWIVHLDNVLQFQVVFAHGDTAPMSIPDRRSNGILSPLLPWEHAMQDVVKPL